MLTIIPWGTTHGLQTMLFREAEQVQLGSEIDFPGREGWDKPTLWVFPRIMVCRGCSFAGFSIPEDQFRSLAVEDVA